MEIGNLIVRDLVIEITRRCNLKCAHCLRGPAQKKSMSKEVIFNTMNLFDSIGCVTISGGEPSLVPHLIQYIAQSNNFNSWYMATNGVKITKRFLESINYLNYNATDNDIGISGLDISDDQFHYGQCPDKLNELFSFCEDNSIACHKKAKFLDYKYILNEGCAKTNEIGEVETHFEKIEIENHNYDYNIDSLLYVNIYGNIYGNCNFSYKSQINKDYIIGSVFDEKEILIEKILNYNKQKFIKN